MLICLYGHVFGMATALGALRLDTRNMVDDNVIKFSLMPVMLDVKMYRETIGLR